MRDITMYTLNRTFITLPNEGYDRLVGQHARKKRNMGRPGGKKPLRGLGLYYVIVKWTLK
jgi:hypothetical protein